MSRNEWERGTIVLPTAAVAQIKQALRKAQNEMHDAVLAEAKRLEPIYVDQKPRRAHFPAGLPETRSEAAGYAYDVIVSRFCDRVGKAKTGRVVPADLRWVVGERATNRTTSFHCGAASVTFDGRKLHWEVADNNHAVDTARAQFLWRTLEQALRSVKWTRGTGGIIAGNDEYNEDAWGASGDYITARYGPLGAAEEEQFAGFVR